MRTFIYKTAPVRAVGMILLVILLSGGLRAQTYREVIQRSNAYYSKNNEMKMQATITGFVHVRDKNGQKLGEVRLHKKGKKFRTTGSDHEMICNGKEILVIDHRGKTAVLFRNNQRMLEKMGNSVNDFDTSVTSADSIVRFLNTDTEIGFRIFSKSGLISQMEMVYSKKNYALRSFTYLLRNESPEYRMPFEKMQVVYNEPQVKNIDEPQASLQAYVQKLKGKYVLSGRLSGYQLSVE